jgi:hypothetical protein
MLVHTAETPLQQESFCEMGAARDAGTARVKPKPPAELLSEAAFTSLM